MDAQAVNGSMSARFDTLPGPWGWFVTLGIALIALGLVFVVADMIATPLSVLMLGWLLVIGALVSLLQSCRARTWGSFFSFVVALLRGAAGYGLIRYPLSAEMGITVILAPVFIVGGIFRALGASTLRFPWWRWSVLSGFVSLVVGFMLIFQLPMVSLGFLGALVGVDFIFDGAAVITVGRAVKEVARRA